METQKTPNNQRNLEKKRMKLEESIFLISNYTTELQSSRQHGTGTKIETNGTRSKAQRLTQAPMDTLFLTKEARIYNGAKTASLIDSAGKTGQLHVKE